VRQGRELRIDVLARLLVRESARDVVKKSALFVRERDDAREPASDEVVAARAGADDVAAFALGLDGAGFVLARKLRGARLGAAVEQVCAAWTALVVAGAHAGEEVADARALAELYESLVSVVTVEVERFEPAADGAAHERDVHPVREKPRARGGLVGAGLLVRCPRRDRRALRAVGADRDRAEPERDGGERDIERSGHHHPTSVAPKPSRTRCTAMKSLIGEPSAPSKRGRPMQ
jgi:hypothetical protein